VRQVARRAAALLKLGIKAGDTVAVLMPNRPAFVINAVALNHIGAIPALINTKLVQTGLRHAVLVSEPTAAIVDATLFAALDEALDGIVENAEAHGLRVFVDGEGGEPVPDVVVDALQSMSVTRSPRVRTLVDLVAVDDGLMPDAAAPCVEAKGEDLAAFIYTSGTTGLPKAGKVLNARITAAGEVFGKLIGGLSRDDTLYCCLPLFHSNGFMVGLGGAIHCGAAFALARRFSASRFWTDIARCEATTFVYIGEICRYLLHSPPHPEERSHDLRYIIGNGMRPDVWEAFVERFEPGKVHEFYGATEGNVNMINPFGRVGAVGFVPPGPLNNALLVKYDPETQTPVRDADGRCIPCKPGEVGELLGEIDNDKVIRRFDGYLDDEATSGKILRDVVEPGDAWFRTGDLLRRDRLYFYYFVDRIGDTFRWKGENVSTNEVADALVRHAPIEIANVYGVKVPGADGRAGMAALVMHEEASFDPDAFYAHVERELPPFARPAFVRVVDTASLTATFKLKKVELVKEGFDPDVVDDPLFVRDEDAGTYASLDEDMHSRVEAGEIRL